MARDGGSAHRRQDSRSARHQKDTSTDPTARENGQMPRPAGAIGFGTAWAAATAHGAKTKPSVGCHGHQRSDRCPTNIRSASWPAEIKPITLHWWTCPCPVRKQPLRWPPNLVAAAHPAAPAAFRSCPAAGEAYPAHAQWPPRTDALYPQLLWALRLQPIARGSSDPCLN